MRIHRVRGLEPPLGWEFELLCQPLELGLIADGVADSLANVHLGLRLPRPEGF
jgi:hypothetical protein